jgi:hypothetical protein
MEDVGDGERVRGEVFEDETAILAAGGIFEEKKEKKWRADY